MVSVAEKDILIEELAGAWALHKESDELLDREFFTLRKWLYCTDPKDMDFDEILKKIEELKNGKI